MRGMFCPGGVQWNIPKNNLAKSAVAGRVLIGDKGKEIRCEL